MASITDWQVAGIDIKVELSTSGDLVFGSKQTNFPFETGGTGGAPLNWVRYVHNDLAPVGNFTFTTQLGVFSVSCWGATTSQYAAGIYYGPFNLKAGMKYSLAYQSRLLQGKDAQSQFSGRLTRWNGTSWGYVTGADGTAQSNWSDSLATMSGTVADSSAQYRIELLGTPPVGGNVAWGVQYRSVVLTEIDTTIPTYTWRDITCDVKNLVIRHGREKYTNRYEAGTLQVILNNDRGDYSYQVNHPFGLRPGRLVRVTATYQGVTYPMAYQVLDQVGDAYDLDGTVIANMSCFDMTTVLSNKRVATAPTAGSTSGKRINSLIDQVGYPFRRLDNGVWPTQGIDASGSTIRDECFVNAESEGASFFADREGYLVYKDRNWPTVDADLTTVTGQFAARPGEGSLVPVDSIGTQPDAPMVCVSELKADWSMDRVINIVTLANKGGYSTGATGNAFTFTDATSVKEHGPQTYQRLDFVLTSDSYLATRADDLMKGYSDPVLRVNSLTFNPQVEANELKWKWTLQAFLNWLVRIWYGNTKNLWGYAVVTHVQSIVHAITPTSWEVQLQVDAPVAFNEVEISRGGFWWDEGLWDVTIWDQSDNDTVPTFGLYWNSGQVWNGNGVVWLGHGWSTGAKWSAPEDDWKK